MGFHLQLHIQLSAGCLTLQAVRPPSVGEPLPPRGTSLPLVLTLASAGWASYQCVGDINIDIYIYIHIYMHIYTHDYNIYLLLEHDMTADLQIYTYIYIF